MRILAGLSMTMLFAGALFAQHSGGRSGASSGGIHRSGGYHLGGSGLVGSGYRGGSVIVVPYVYPGYVGGGYYYPPDYSAGYTDGSYAPVQAPPQPVMIVVPPQPPPGANPEPVSPYQPSAAQGDDQSGPDHYLIALKDHSIYSVVAYWVDGDTLHYFTAGNVHNQASLSLVDRDLTARLNKESANAVNLPAPK